MVVAELFTEKKIKKKLILNLASLVRTNDCKSFSVYKLAANRCFESNYKP